MFFTALAPLTDDAAAGAVRHLYRADLANDTLTLVTDCPSGSPSVLQSSDDGERLYFLSMDALTLAPSRAFCSCMCGTTGC